MNQYERTRQVRLVARHAGAQWDLTRLGKIVADLPGGNKAFLAQIAQIRKVAEDISGVRSHIDEANDDELREKLAERLLIDIQSFFNKSQQFDDPLSSEFCRAAENWLRTATRQLSEMRQLAKMPFHLKAPDMQTHLGDAVGMDAAAWRATLDRTKRHLERGESIIFHVYGDVNWRGWLEQLRDSWFPKLAVVDLDNPLAVPRNGLIGEILRAVGRSSVVPPPPDDLPELRRGMDAAGRCYVALVHFDRIANRPHYGMDLVSPLRYLTMETRQLVLLLHTRVGVDTILPINHQLSKIDFKTVELGPSMQTVRLFRAGDPVERGEEAFVPRINVLAQLEQEVMLATGCPGLLIYGRRRTGKTTMLRSVGDFLPASVRTVLVSMQNPFAFRSIASFSRLICEELGKVMTLSSERGADLEGLFAVLGTANGALEPDNRRTIVAFDEFEQFDLKIGDGTFSEDLLPTIRESIQMHRRLIWVFAGSHHITELRHAPWDSYFVSLRTIEIPLFSEAETHLLLTEPLKESPLYAQSDLPRPHYDAAFWGEGGIDWIHRETAGWPYLVQLLASTAIDLVNEGEVVALNAGMLEQAAGRAIVEGDIVLRHLMRAESQLPGEWDYLAGFRTKDEQPPPDDEAILQSLRHRQLMVEENRLWRLRVPLMQRWLRERR